MKKFTLFCILALVALMVVPAYAEVQNVKVSGDLSAQFLARQNYSLDQKDSSTTGIGSNKWDHYFLSTAGVEVTADLTDNVSTVVRLANQRDWGVTSAKDRAGSTNQDFNMLVDLANVTLKELIYSPLTVTVGRQDLWFGKAALRLGHRVTRRDLTVEQRMQVALLLLLGAEQREDLGVAGVGGLRSENRRGPA